MPPESFVLGGEDWFALPDESVLPWSKILAVVETEQRRLAAIVADIDQPPPMADTERFNLVLGPIVVADVVAAVRKAMSSGQ